MTLRAMVQTAGVAVAQNEADLSFTSPGQINKIYVNVGDHVTVDQALIGLKADELQNAVTTAQSALTLAQLQLQKLQEGATDTDLGKAAEAVVTANAELTTAQNALKDATDPPTDAELTAAHQAVAAAEAALSAAQDKLQTLKDGAGDADIAAAQAALDAAKAKVTQAQNAQQVASAQEADAQSAFQSAGAAYCGLSGALSDICDSMTANDYQHVLTSGQVHELLTDSPPLALEAAISALATANDTYRSAIAGVSTANDAVTAAISGRDAAQKALDKANDGASSDDIDTAEQGVTAAQAAVDASQAALQKLIDGPTNTQIADLQAAVDKAQADVLAAQIASDEVGRGATATELAMQQEEVHQAQLTLDRANLALGDMTLKSPFDGVVSALPVKIGQVVNATVPAVTVLTPGQMIFDLNVGETDLPSVKLGQQGTVRFDALPAYAFPIEVTAVSLSPTTNQGVIIYEVKCKVSPDPGDPASLQSVAPGMNGSANLVTDTRQGVVAIPSSLVRTRGTQQVVEVEVSPGKTAMVPVATGLSDGNNIEITSGVKVGDILAVHAAATPTPASADQQLPGHFQ